MDVGLTLLTAGACSHPEAVSRRGAPWRPIDFPALVGVIRHPERGVVLFDTGYAPRFFDATAHLPEALYARATPVRCAPHESALARLETLGIRADEVRTVVLSHLHADHVGGVLDFPAARIVVLRDALAPLRLPRGMRQVKRGVLAALLPDDLDDRVLLVDDLAAARPGLPGPLGPGRDLFGDGSLVLVPLPGHAAGHLGLLVRTATARILLVGDAAWSTRAVTRLELPHPVVRLVTHQWSSYAATIGALSDLGRDHPDLHIVPSHCSEAIARAHAALGAGG